MTTNIVAKNKTKILPPSLLNNPSWDVIVTRLNPLLSFFNADGGPKQRAYEIQLDTSKNFTSKDKVVYKKVKQGEPYVTDKKVDKADMLKDNQRYYWRVRTVTDSGKSKWATSRFTVDTKSDTAFMDMVRVPVKKIEVSNGYNSKNIIDWDDPGLLTFWQSPPPGDKEQWVKFDLGKSTEISRAWILSNFNDPTGWLKDFVLQSSTDGEKWRAIKGTATKNNRSYRNILNFKPVKARYFRLLISSFIGYAAQVNEMILYSPGQPPVPKVPKEDYVLIIGNEHNGFTFTDLAKYVEALPGKLKTVTVPCYEASMKMLQSLSRRPVAIILSGNNADYPDLPMFEYNGEFEIIRKTNLPMLGICAGHQYLAMAYGYTRARSMGWFDDSAMTSQKKLTRVKINKPDPIFKGMSKDFTAPEVHSWAVAEPAEEFVQMASSTYLQVQKSTKRFIYGLQFHPEIDVSYNHGKKVLENFLEMALERE
ncbi:discoidin domain-containing protein [Patescibacteria group bacterium]